VSGITLSVSELSAEAFRPYGRVIETPARARDAWGPGWTWWAETMMLPTDGRRFGVGYLSLEPSELRFDWAERHMRTVEVVVPLGRECLVYVGPPDHPEDPPRMADLERFEVFRVPPGGGVAMDPGVWHGAPLALDRPTSAMVLILEGTGKHDVTIVRFEERPATIARPGAQGVER
jgi:ureidoglycolate lyase